MENRKRNQLHEVGKKQHPPVGLGDGELDHDVTQNLKRQRVEQWRSVVGDGPRELQEKQGCI